MMAFLSLQRSYETRVQRILLTSVFSVLILCAVFMHVGAASAEEVDPTQCFICHYGTYDLYLYHVTETHHVDIFYREEYMDMFYDENTGFYNCLPCHKTGEYTIGRYGYACLICHAGDFCISNVWQCDYIPYSGNMPPILDPIGDRSGYEGQLLMFEVSATDPDGDILTLSADNLPPGAEFDTATATFSWTPGYDQTGIYENVVFSVSDNGYPMEQASESITITIGNVNRAPVVTAVGPQEILEYYTLQFTVSAVDPDGDDIVSMYAGGLPVGAEFNGMTGLFSWRPDGTQEGVHVVSFYADDDGEPVAMTGQIDVVIKVGMVSTPTDLADIIINEVLAAGLPLEVENSYMANLKKVNTFIRNGKTIPAVNQLEAFINKVQVDIAHGILEQADGDLFIMMADDVINLLAGS